MNTNSDPECFLHSNSFNPEQPPESVACYRRGNSFTEKLSTLINVTRLYVMKSKLKSRLRMFFASSNHLNQEVIGGDLLSGGQVPNPLASLSILYLFHLPMENVLY